MAQVEGDWEPGLGLGSRLWLSSGLEPGAVLGLCREPTAATTKLSRTCSLTRADNKEGSGEQGPRVGLWSPRPCVPHNPVLPVAALIPTPSSRPVSQSHCPPP